MGTLINELRYALRQFLVARISTATAVLTLALGIGGTTAIFTLIHAVMLRSLPVSDPSRLYRVGDGDSCCVQGGPQDRWGMFSFPLFERLKAELPEFEELTAFQAGGARVSVRRQHGDTTSRPLRSEYVTGNYFSTLGVSAFGGRVFTAADDTPAAQPVVVLSHHLWQGTYGADPSIVGGTFVVEGHPFTVAGITAPGFCGETLRGDPPDLVRGRHFTAADTEHSENVAVVNEAFVRRFFKSDEDPIDAHFGLDLPENVNTYRIVGIVRDAKFAGFALDRPARPMFFVSLAQTVNYENVMMKRLESGSHFVRGLLLVTSTPPGTLEPQVKRALAEVDPNLTVTTVRTMQQQVNRSFDQQRAVATLAGLFGLVALVLAAIGLYGVTAYSVAQRPNEIGIRMALGANRRKVIELVLHGAFRRVVVGLALGLPLAVAAGRLLSAQLFGVPFWDPLALGVGTVSLAACAFFAAIIPAA